MTLTAFEELSGMKISREIFEEYVVPLWCGFPKSDKEFIAVLDLEWLEQKSRTLLNKHIQDNLDFVPYISLHQILRHVEELHKWYDGTMINILLDKPLTIQYVDLKSKQVVRQWISKA